MSSELRFAALGRLVLTEFAETVAPTAPSIAVSLVRVTAATAVSLAVVVAVAVAVAAPPAVAEGTEDLSTTGLTGADDLSVRRGDLGAATNCVLGCAFVIVQIISYIASIHC